MYGVLLNLPTVRVISGTKTNKEMYMAECAKGHPQILRTRKRKSFRLLRKYVWPLRRRYYYTRYLQ